MRPPRPTASTINQDFKSITTCRASAIIYTGATYCCSACSGGGACHITCVGGGGRGSSNSISKRGGRGSTSAIESTGGRGLSPVHRLLSASIALVPELLVLMLQPLLLLLPVPRRGSLARVNALADALARVGRAASGAPSNRARHAPARLLAARSLSDRLLLCQGDDHLWVDAWRSHIS